MSITIKVLDYTVNNYGIIVGPGKFSGELYFVPYLWEQALEDGDFSPGRGTTLKVVKEDVERFAHVPESWPKLAVGQKYTLWEDAQGFVYCEETNV